MTNYSMYDNGDVIKPTQNSVLLNIRWEYVKCRKDFCKMPVVYVSFDVLEADKLSLWHSILLVH